MSSQILPFRCPALKLGPRAHLGNHCGIKVTDGLVPACCPAHAAQCQKYGGEAYSDYCELFEQVIESGEWDNAALVQDVKDARKRVTNTCLQTMEHGRERCTKVKDPVQEAMVFRGRLEQEARQELREEKQRTAAMLRLEMKRNKKQVLALPHGEFQKLLEHTAAAAGAASGSGSGISRLLQNVAEPAQPPAPDSVEFANHVAYRAKHTVLPRYMSELKVKLLAEKIAKGEDYGVAMVEDKPVRIDSWNGNAHEIMKLMLADNFISRFEVSYGDLNGDGAEYVVQQYLKKVAAM
eukprot:jgi/Chrzof1/2799/UNPLg00713.t1